MPDSIVAPFRAEMDEDGGTIPAAYIPDEYVKSSKIIQSQDPDNPHDHGSPPSNSNAKLSYLPNGNAAITTHPQSPCPVPRLLHAVFVKPPVVHNHPPHSTPRDQNPTAIVASQWPPIKPRATLPPVDAAASMKLLAL
ncbi:hypothetical protein EW146_g6860 [Bondarzewia mesenterica]|uniref:Uncharacterized protein n=1 Tax=Bondarzewia mesenterica TaxID=1095465 RepID=A0A4S4LMC9_9AGAM|nr:hypothetical protein EW146_g6860 [Bondarzewia mesenterica]